MMQTSAVVLWNLILLWILFGFSGIALINVQFLYPVIQKLIPEDAKEEATPDNAFTVNEDADLSSLGYGPAVKKEEDAAAVKNEEDAAAVKNEEDAAAVKEEDAIATPAGEESGAVS